MVTESLGGRGIFTWRLGEWAWAGQAENEKERFSGWEVVLCWERALCFWGSGRDQGGLSGVYEERVVQKRGCGERERPCWLYRAWWPNGKDFFHNWISSLCKVLSRRVRSIYSLEDHCQLTRDGEREMRVKSRKMCRRLQPSLSRQEHITVLGQKWQNVDRFTRCSGVRNERLR